jgi:hypothetical protein
MQLSDCEKLRINIWEQMRAIEAELFLLSARSGELGFEDGQRFEQLCGERTQLASGVLRQSFLKSDQCLAEKPI